MKKQIYLKALLIICFFSFINLGISQTGSFTDQRDGQEYNTIEIGNQTWMAENLNYKTETDSWCPENSENLCTDYGRLYTFEVALNVCPLGWHLPTDDEFNVLVVYLGGPEIVGNKMKEKGIDYWAETTDTVTNSSGFSARGSGNRWLETDFDEVGEWISFWTATKAIQEFEDEIIVWTWTLYSDDTGIDHDTDAIYMGLSVRCIKD